MAEGYISSGTVTGHYLSFLKMTLDEMDKHPQMKDHYIVMDNASHSYVRKHCEIYIKYRGYKCVYLPTYSPELNPIEQFWAVAKSKVKRHRFLQKDILSKRITEACKNVEWVTFVTDVTDARCLAQFEIRPVVLLPIHTTFTRVAKIGHKRQFSFNIGVLCWHEFLAMRDLHKGVVERSRIDSCHLTRLLYSIAVTMCLLTLLVGTGSF
ncbi:unnamed protein product [Rhizopus microsporus]